MWAWQVPNTYWQSYDNLKNTLLHKSGINVEMWAWQVPNTYWQSYDVFWVIIILVLDV